MKTIEKNVSNVIVGDTLVGCITTMEVSKITQTKDPSFINLCGIVDGSKSEILYHKSDTVIIKANGNQA